MSMEINGNYEDWEIGFAKRTEGETHPDKAEKAGEAGKDIKGTEISGEAGKEQKNRGMYGGFPDFQDEYISSEESGRKPVGLYRLGQDENGNQKIFFEDPRKAGNKEGKEQPGVKPDGPEGAERSGEKCVGNTDMVDREIKELKQERQQLEQQIRAVSGDEEKVRELEQELKQVENELSLKDNDTYRKQHSSFTSL